MFTGIIEELGKVKNISTNGITIECKTVLEETKAGDSIAVNGVCLTVRKLTPDSFAADVSPESFRVTVLKDLRCGDFVNLERALPAGGRLGGHFVTGHVDGKGKILSIGKNAEFYDLKVELDSDEVKYCVKKGSVAINGISLTIADIEKNTVMIALIPHTYENTNLKYLKNGSFVNIETDILSKYVEKFLLTRDNKSGIDLEFLQRNGF